MLNKIILIFFIFPVLLLQVTQVQIFSAETAARPKIGVVLSGGGAKCFAQISVLRTLEKLNIPVDYIGGTSMGGIIAALYAMGYNADEIEAIVRNTNWSLYFENKPDRSNSSLIQKLYFFEYPVSLNMTRDGIKTPRGFINGQKTGLFLSRLSWRVQNIYNYKDLPIPFICVATDFENGTAVIFDRGILARSLSASMAIPYIFQPIEIDGKVYLDGGMVNNFPVREVRDMGADIIIGVDVSSRLYKQGELTSVPKIMEQAISFLGESKTMEQRKLCDILIIPRVSQLSALDFDRTDEMLKKGDEAALLQTDKLKKLSEQMSSYNIKKRNRVISADEDSSVVINRVEYHNLKNVSEDVIKLYIDIEPGDRITADEIENSINTIYGFNFFELIHYNISRDGDENVLHLYFKENPEGHLNFGLSFDLYLKAAALVGLGYRNLGFQNTETIIKARIGDYSKFDFTYIVYTPINPGIWFNINANIYNMDLFTYEGSDKTSVYEFWQQSTSLDMNLFYSNWFLLSLGIRKEFYFIDSSVVAYSEQKKYKFDTLAYNAKLKIDTMDRMFYATNGLFVDTEFDYVKTDIYTRSDVLTDKPFQRGLLSSSVALPLWKRFSFHAGETVSSVSSNQTPPSYWIALGGAQKYENWIFPLNGYQLMEKTATNGWVYYTDIQYELFNNFFLLARWNEGKVVSDYNKLFEYSDTSSAYGLVAGYITPFGPVEMSIFRKTYSNDYAFHFALGLIF